MNKKILSIFALIMAISILGVSCAENPNNPNNGGGGKPAFGIADIKKVVKAIGTLSPANGSFDLTTKDVENSVTKDNNNYTATVTGTATGNVTTDALKTALDAKKNAMGTAVTPDNITIDSIYVAAPTGDNKSVVATIPYTTSDGKTGNIKITFKLGGDNNYKFTGEAVQDKEQDVEIATTGTKEAPLTVTLADSDVTTAAFGINAGTTGDPDSYELVSVVGLGTDAGVANVTDDISGVNGINVKDNYTLNSSAKTLTIKKAIVDELKKTLNTADKKGAIEVTINAKKANHKDKPLKFYVLITGVESAQKTPIAKTALQGEIAAWGEVGEGNDKLIFTGATLGNGGNTISIKAKGNSTGPSVNAIKTAIGTLTKKSLTGIQTIEVTNGDFDAQGTLNQEDRTFTIILTAADTHEFSSTDFTAGVSGGVLTITVTVSPTSDGSAAANWAA